MVDTEADLDIRKATSTNRPLGNGWFLDLLEKELSRVLTVNKVGKPKIKKLNREVSLISHAVCRGGT